MEATQVATPEVQMSLKKEEPVFRAPKKRKKWLKLLVVLLVLGLMSGVGVFFLRRAEGNMTTGEQYTLAPAQRRDLKVTVDGTGTVQAIQTYQVGALVTGEVLEAPLEVGDRVEKGDLLYRIAPGKAQTALQQAQLSLRQAKLDYAEKTVNLTPRASASGVVQKVYVRKGDLVSPGTAIAEITDTSTMTITLPFHSMDAQSISPGQSAQVTLSGTMETLTGSVESVSSADVVGVGGTLVRLVKLRVNNPGAITAGGAATATVGEISCASSGSFEENMRQTVVAQASGEVTEVLVTAGSQVSAGSALVTLGGSTVQTAMEYAEIAIENAQITCRQAQESLEGYTITAPISGTVIEKNIKAGDKVDGIDSGKLAVIYDLSCLTFPMNVNELDIGKVQPGQEVEITAAALPGEVFRGVVDRVSINGTTTNGFTTYPAVIRIEEYGDLKPGMNVSAKIQGDMISDALTVPVSSVSRGNKVMVAPADAIGENGSLSDPALLEERVVRLGISDDQFIQITDGLEEGDMVAYQDAGMIKAGG